MIEPSSNDAMDFKQALFASYANIAIMEIRLHNDDDSRLRPTFKETLYLYSIWSRDGCTASDLVKLFDSSKALVSQTIIGMEKKGYIVREQDKTDRRKQILKISPQRLSGGVEEFKLIDSSITALSAKYTEEELSKSAKIIYEFTENMCKEVTKVQKD